MKTLVSSTLLLLALAPAPARAINKKRLALRIAAHGLAAFDAWTTYRNARMPAAPILWSEGNPVYRPVAASPWVFVVSQVDLTVAEVVEHRTRRPWLRWTARSYQAWISEEHLRQGIGNLHQYNRAMQERAAACATVALGSIPGPDWQCPAAPSRSILSDPKKVLDNTMCHAVPCAR